MIIDAHTHIGYANGILGTVDELLASMDAAGIDFSLVFGSHIADCDTPRLLTEIAPHADRLGAVGVVSPYLPQRELLQDFERRLQEKTLVAAKFYTGYEHYYPSDYAARPYLELLAQHGIPAIFHSGDCYCKVGKAKLKYAHPLHIDELAVDMPKLTIVIAHMGNPWIVDGAEVCYKNSNVFADCSGFVCGDFSMDTRESYMRHVRHFMDYVETPEKLLFGSDWPIAAQSSYVRATEAALQGGSTVTELVLSGNALRVYGLKKKVSEEAASPKKMRVAEEPQP